MTSRWFRRSRGRDDDDRLRDARATLTTTFLELENRQSEIDSAVQASSEIYPRHELARRWELVREVCYGAAAAYLAAIGGPDNPSSREGSATHGPGGSGTLAVIDQSQKLLDAAVTAVAEFDERHRMELRAAIYEAGDVRRGIEQATTVCDRAEQLLAAADARYTGYPSVIAAAAELGEARRMLAAEAMANRLPRAREASARVQSAATRLRSALADAPGTGLRAQQAVSSARTRLEAVINRSTTIRPNFSVLLREFPGASSNDLSANGERSTRDITIANDFIGQAGYAVSHNRPEEALDLTRNARQHLANAEQLVDAVADRLELLRQLRADPTDKERRVRFELREAQRLAVALGGVEQWASVLDAQVARIDRIVEQIAVRRPDFWAYAQALDEVSKFIAVTVSKIRRDVRSDGR